MSDKPEIRYCKKCGCELTSTNKKKLCENCRRNKNGVVKNIGAALLGVAFIVITKGKSGGLKK
ncbi:MAG: hypothetical protein J6I55_10340 [Ruminococcus sp.]|nr:hypothetical protein [Ruminococcus sp.]